MPKKKTTAHIRAAVLRAARKLCFTVIQNTKILCWQKTRDLRDTRPWRKKKRGKECHSPCKTAFDTLSGQKQHRIQLSSSDQCFRSLNKGGISLNKKMIRNSKVQFQPPVAKGNVFLIFQLIFVLWQNTKLHKTLDIKKQRPLKFWIISASCITSTFQELFFSDKIFGNLSLNYTHLTSIIHETAHEGAQDYVLKSQYHCCHTATWCLTMGHADLSGKKKGLLWRVE